MSVAEPTFGLPIRPQVGYQATVPYRFGCVFVALLCFPGLGELPGGISLALVAMFACLPSWCNAACSRQRLVLDTASQVGSTAVLCCVGFLIVWSLISVVGADRPFLAGRYVATQLAAFSLYLLVVGTVTEPRLRVYLAIACLTLALTCLLSFVGFYEFPSAFNHLHG